MADVLEGDASNGVRSAETRVLIGIPNYTGWCREEAALSRMQMMDFTARRLPDARLDICWVEGHNVEDARWQIVRTAMIHKVTHVFFLDSDMIVPPFTLYTLLYMDTDICAGLGFTNSMDAPVPSMFKYLEPDERPDWNKADSYAALLFYKKAQYPIIEVDAMGLHCTLIKMKVFDTMNKRIETFVDAFNPFRRDNGLGEDFSFCKRAKTLGFRLFVHTGIKCGHIARQPVVIDENYYTQNFRTDKYGVPGSIVDPDSPRVTAEQETNSDAAKLIEEYTAIIEETTRQKDGIDDGVHVSDVLPISPTDVK